MNLKTIMEEVKNNINNITIIDVEATCWENDKEKKDSIQEVIEIGISQIKNGKIIKRPSIFIIPQHSKVSSFCTKLTSLTQNFIEKNGVSPTEGYNKLKKEFVSDTWGSYGEFDKNILNRMFQLYKLPNILPEKHINVRLLAAQKLKNSSNPKDVSTGAKKTLESTGMKFKGRHHLGSDDAFNIARLYNYLIGIKK